MIGVAAPARPVAAPRRRPAPLLAGGGTPLASTVPVGRPVAPWRAALASLVQAIAGWFRRLFSRPASNGPAPTPGYPSYPAASGSVLAAPLTPIAGGVSQDGRTTAAVGWTSVNGTTGVAARADAVGDGRVLSGVIAVTPGPTGLVGTAGARLVTPTVAAEGQVQVDGQGVAGTVAIAGPRVQGNVVAGVTRATTAVAGQVQARVGEQTVVQAAGALVAGPEGTSAQAGVAIANPTTRASVQYQRDGATQAVGGQLEHRLPHSVLGVGGDYRWSPEGDGGRVYGRYQTDPIGERIGGWTVRGGLEAGAMKLPGQEWNGYAAGRVSADRDNASLFLQVDQRFGPSSLGGSPGVMVGAQFRF